MKIDNLKNEKILFTDENSLKDGINFEHLIVEQLWNNTFDCLTFPENNKLKVKEIFELKNNKEIKNNLISSEPIIIRQTIFEGKFYDFLLIINQNGKKCAIFFQIGINKTGNQINYYINNLIKNSEKYKLGIENLINNKIDSLGFMLIFDYEYQKKFNQKNNIKSEGIGFCDNNNIDYLIYKDFQLFKTMEDILPIDHIEITLRVKKMKIIIL